MSYRSAFLKNFATPIAMTIAAGAMTVVFNTTGVFDRFTAKEEPKPKCVEVKDPQTGLAQYNPECKPEHK